MPLKSVTLYGIKNCDTVKKARRWFDDNGIDYLFHDFRQDGLEASLVLQWTTRIDWEVLVNKRSTSWRNLDEDSKQNLSKDTIVELLIANPTLIKRPVVDIKGTDCLFVGFNQNHYEEQLLK